MKLTERLLGLELCLLPVWVFDPERIKFRWANIPAAELWGASSIAEFLARDLADISDAVKVRLRSFLPTLQTGVSIREDFTFYPKGKPVTLSCVVLGIPLDEGNLGLLAQVAFQHQQLDVSLVRGVEALRHSSVMVSLIDGSGLTVMRNAATVSAFGEAAFGTWFCQPDVPGQLLQVLAGAAVYAEEVQVETVGGRRWHSVDARAINDPASGERVVLVQQVDVTKRRTAEDTAVAQSQLAAQLARTLALVQAQHNEIVELSAPILEVREGTLLLPLIGALTAERGNAITQRVLSAIVHHRARNVILDLTGTLAGTLETDSAIPGQLSKLAHAIALLGSKVILSGTSPKLAQALADSGVDFTGLPIGQRLADGLRLSQDTLIRPQAAEQRTELARTHGPVPLASEQTKGRPT